MLHVIFLNYQKLSGSSGIHIHPIASRLARHGIRATVLAPGDPMRMRDFGTTDFDVRLLSRWNILRTVLAALAKGERPILHCWTPRETVRPIAEWASRVLRCPFIVHLEDNELHLAQIMPVPAASGRRRPNITSDPARLQHFLGAACGITYLIDRLEQFCPPDTPRLMFWPACEDAFFELDLEPEIRMRRELGLSSDSFVVFYPGNAHPGIADDIARLYEAVRRLHEGGLDIVLLRAGADHVDDSRLKLAGPVPWLVALGERPAHDMPKLMSAANAVVQPGEPGPFNDFRFPSKLPMALAAGRPTVLPATNIGRFLKAGEECLLLRSGDVEDLIASIAGLAADRALCRRIGTGGRAFARKHLSWDRTVAQLANFYLSLSPPAGVASSHRRRVK